MIRSVNIVGVQCSGTHAQYGQHPQGQPQYKYYGSVEQNDQDDLNEQIKLYHFISILCLSMADYVWLTVKPLYV